MYVFLFFVFCILSLSHVQNESDTHHQSCPMRFVRGWPGYHVGIKKQDYCILYHLCDRIFSLVMLLLLFVIVLHDRVSRADVYTLCEYFVSVQYCVCYRQLHGTVSLSRTAHTHTHQHKHERSRNPYKNSPSCNELIQMHSHWPCIDTCVLVFPKWLGRVVFDFNFLYKNVSDLSVWQLNAA